jgi:hypothetical protein
MTFEIQMRSDKWDFSNPSASSFQDEASPGRTRHNVITRVRLKVIPSLSQVGVVLISRKR